MYENVTAIIPAYNEEKYIIETLNAVKKIEYITEIIIVDDGSKDKTCELLESVDGVIFIQNKAHKGKGWAVQSALPYVSNDFIILIDADLRQSALELRNLVSNTKRNTKTMLIAVYPRPLTKGGFGIVKGLSKKGLYLLTSKTTDSVLSGQRLMSTAFIRSIKIPRSFGMEFKVTLEALKNEIDIVEVPVNIRHRETGRNIMGFLHRGKQFVSILNVLFRELI